MTSPKREMRKRINKAIRKHYRWQHRRKSKGPPSLTPSATSLAIAHRNQQQSKLLRLPSELRNTIFSIAMDTRSPRLHFGHRQWDRLSLSRTCHQVFAETASRYYNTKLEPLVRLQPHLCDLHMVIHCVALFTPAQKRMIRSVRAEWLAVQGSSSQTCAKFLKGLTELKLVVLVGAPSTKMTRRTAGSISGLREAVGDHVQIELTRS